MKVNGFKTNQWFLTLWLLLVLSIPLTLYAQSTSQQPAPAQETSASNEEELQIIREPDVVFVPTPQDVVDEMLKLAEVKKEDVVYDLGCGDGRIVVTAAKRYGCKGFGYDIDPARVKESRENVKRNNVDDWVKIEQKDIFTLDLSEADVVTLYLLPTLNVKLIPQLEKLKPGTRIVSHDFDMKGVKPDKVIKVLDHKEQGDASSKSTIYLWTVPLNKDEDKQIGAVNKGKNN